MVTNSYPVCPVCHSQKKRFLYAEERGKGKYECENCELTFKHGAEFIRLTDDERTMLAEMAFGVGNEELEQEVSDRREFAEGNANEIRDLVARALESGAVERHFDEDTAENLFERLNRKLFPRNYED